MRAGWITVAVLGSALGGAPAQAAPTWGVGGTVAPGRQFATATDPAAGVVHLIAERYVQVDASGSVVVDEDTADGRQGPLDFQPAIAVGPDGTVHAVTRHGGDFGAGHDIRYRRRAGAWDPEVAVGSPVERNYVVGVVAPTGGRVLVMHSRLIVDVNSVIDVYAIEGAAANYLGETPQGWLRPDNDFRVATTGNAVLLASGKPGPGDADGPNVAFAADVDGDVLAQWSATLVTHDGGSPRRGNPDLFVDGTGQFHLGYGADQEAYYSRYGADGSRAVGVDPMVIGSLGTWHLSHGISTVAASDDGMQIVVVGLRNDDGDATAENSELVWTFSADAGATWDPVASLGANTDGGEGRMKPRLAVLGDAILLFFFDVASGSISVATAQFDGDPPGTTGGMDTGSGDAVSDTSSPPDGDGDSSPVTGGGDPTGASDSGVVTSGTIPPGGRGGGGDGCGCRRAPAGSPWVLLVAFVVVRRRPRLRVA